MCRFPHRRYIEKVRPSEILQTICHRVASEQRCPQMIKSSVNVSIKGLGLQQQNTFIIFLVTPPRTIKTINPDVNNFHSERTNVSDLEGWSSNYECGWSVLEVIGCNLRRTCPLGWWRWGWSLVICPSLEWRRSWISPLATAPSWLMERVSAVFIGVFVLSIQTEQLFIYMQIRLTAKYDRYIHLVDKKKNKRAVLLMFIFRFCSVGWYMAK